MAEKSTKRIEQLAESIRSLSANEREELLSLLATLEESDDPGALSALHESEGDVREGRLYGLDEIFR